MSTTPDEIAREKRSRIYVGAADIQHRAEDALIPYDESQALAKLVNQIDEELDSKDQHSRSELFQVGYLSRLVRCLWEAPIVKICACWARSNRFRVIVDSDKPRLVIDDIASIHIRKSLDGLWKLRVGQIAHPISQQQAMNGPLQIQSSDVSRPSIVFNHVVGTAYFAPDITVEQLNDVVDVSEYTTKEAKRLQNLNADIGQVGKIEETVWQESGSLDGQSRTCSPAPFYLSLSACTRR